MAKYTQKQMNNLPPKTVQMHSQLCWNSQTFLHLWLEAASNQGTVLIYSQNKQGIPLDIFCEVNHGGIIRFGSILIIAVWLLKFSALWLMLPSLFSGLHYTVIGLRSWQEDQVNGAASPASRNNSFSLMGLQMRSADSATIALSRLGFSSSQRSH